MAMMYAGAAMNDELSHFCITRRSAGKSVEGRVCDQSLLQLHLDKRKCLPFSSETRRERAPAEGAWHVPTKSYVMGSRPSDRDLQLGKHFVSSLVL